MASVSKLAAQANAALEQNLPHEAAQLFVQVLQRDPGYRDALFYMANYCFQLGRLDEAMEFARRYVHLEPGHAAPRRLLGEIAEAKGDQASALALYQQAVDCDDTAGVSYLYLAALYASQGRNNTAAQLASRAFELDARLHFVPDDAAAHPGVRERAQRMLRIISEVLSRHHRSAAKTERIKALRWCATDDTNRDDRTRDHNPFLIDLPGVTRMPYLDSPVAEALAAHGQTIAEEIRAGLNASADGVAQAPLHLGAGVEEDGWRALHFWRGGLPEQATIARFPKTAAILQDLPLSRSGGVPAYAWISILQPGTEVPDHFGASAAHVTIHLGIDVPEGNCVLHVLGEEREWRAGEAFAFMDSFTHGSWNHTDRPRVILVVQAPHPDLTAEEAADLQACLDARTQWMAERVRR